MNPFLQQRPRLGVLMASLTAVLVSPKTTAFIRPSGLRAHVMQPISMGVLTSTIVMAINVATGMLLARSLGPHDRGALAAVILWPSLLAGIGSLGVSEAGAYFAARGLYPLGHLTGTIIVIVLVQALILCSAGLVVVPTVLASHDAATVRTAMVYLAFIPLTLMASALLWLLNGSGQEGWFQGLRLGVYVVPAAAFVILAADGELTVRTAAIVYLIANAAVVAAVMTVLLHTTHGRFVWDRAVAWQVLHYGIRGHTSTVSGVFNERLDQMLISIFLAPTKLGLYVVAVTMTSFTTMIGSSIAMVALPTVSRSKSADEIRHVVLKFVRTAVLLSGLATLPLLVIMPLVVTLFFGQPYSEAVDIARLLLIAAVFLSCGRVFQAILKGLGAPLAAGVAEGMALVVTVVAVAVLMPLFGLMGAALASLFSYAASAVWALRQVSSRAGLKPAELFNEITRPASGTKAAARAE